MPMTRSLETLGMPVISQKDDGRWGLGSGTSPHLTQECGAHIKAGLLTGGFQEENKKYYEMSSSVSKGILQ